MKYSVFAMDITFAIHTVADPEFSNGGRRRRRRDVESRRVGAERRGVWGGGVPLPRGDGVWGGGIDKFFSFFMPK